jgi:hypothetical protein
MSYRDDHDAAIARVDALTHELDRSEARREHLEAERKQLEAERDRLKTEVDLVHALPRAKLRWTRVALIVVVFFCGIALKTFGHDHHWRDTAPPPPSPPIPLTELRAPRVSPPPSRFAPATSEPAAPATKRSAGPYGVDTVVACAARTQRETDSIATLTDLRPLRATCRPTIESLLRSSAISDKARQLLTRWLALEDRLAPSLAAYNSYILRDPGEKRYRAPAALRKEFHAMLRDRSAVLAALPAALER